MCPADAVWAPICDDVHGVPVTSSDAASALLAGYDTALAQVYGYLLPRCGQRALAEDLTSQVFLAAVDAVRRDAENELGTGWLIGTARHKLLDHWRRQAREQRELDDIAADPTRHAADSDPWDAELDVLRAREVLLALSPAHRTALALRYLDDLPVPEVAAHLGRTLHATEALLVRGRRAFRVAWEASEQRVAEPGVAP